jgi:hypothetical protein
MGHLQAQIMLKKAIFQCYFVGLLFYYGRIFLNALKRSYNEETCEGSASIELPSNMDSSKLGSQGK